MYENKSITDTDAKCRHLKILTCKETLRQVFIRVYSPEIQSVMLVFSTQLFNYCSSNLSGFTLLPLPCVNIFQITTFALLSMILIFFLRFQPFSTPPLWAIAFRTLKLREPLYCIAYPYSTRCIYALHITVSGRSTKIKYTWVTSPSELKSQALLLFYLSEMSSFKGTVA